MAIDVGTGTTISFGTSLWTCRVTNIGDLGSERKAVDTTYLGSTASESVPGRILDNGSITLEVQHDPDYSPPMSGAAETITVTLYSGKTYSFSGFMTSYKMTGITTDELIKANVSIKVSGAITGL